MFTSLHSSTGMVIQTFYSSSPSSMSSPSCSPLYTPRLAWSYRLSTPHHHHQCHHHHVHLFTLLDWHGHTDFLLLITIINVITIMSTSLHSSTGMVIQTFYSSSPSSMSSPSCPPLYTP